MKKFSDFLDEDTTNVKVINRQIQIKIRSDIQKALNEIVAKYGLKLTSPDIRAMIVSDTSIRVQVNVDMKV